MQSTIKTVLEFALLALTSIFFLVDPFAVIPLFLAVTTRYFLSRLSISAW